jgi:hypothetical protein
VNLTTSSSLTREQIQKSHKLFGNLRKFLKCSGKIQKDPERSRKIPRERERSREIPKDTESSEILQTLRNTQKNFEKLRKPPQASPRQNPAWTDRD